MSRWKLLVLLFISALLLAVLQYIVITVYDRVPNEWVYTPSHVLGGFITGLLAVYFSRVASIRLSFLATLSAVLFVGIAWEILEYSLGFNMLALDTGSDIVADLVGGSLAFLLAQRMRV